MAAIKSSRLILLFFLVFILTGCQSAGVSDGLKILNDNLGKALNSLNENQASSTFNFFSHSSSTVPTEKTSTELSNTDKQAIDAWLEKKGLNRYGDAKNAVYTGGTPLFDEQTGKSTERYAYILNKFPNILDIIKEGK
jgi:hypothetical protein